MDETGAIIGQLDRRLCDGCPTLQASSWIERFTVPPELAKRTKRLGFGVYGGGTGVGPLQVTGGVSDWEGRRLLIDVP
jgi:hypothetical protein